MKTKHSSLALTLFVAAALTGLGCDHLKASDASAAHEGKDQKGVTAAASGGSTMPASDRYGASAGSSQPQ